MGLGMEDMPITLALHGGFDPIKIKPHKSADSLNRNFAFPIRATDRFHADLKSCSEFVNG
jgi:hypothetical protein